MKLCFLHIAQKLGGAEKRFFNLLDYISKEHCTDNVTVIIGRDFFKNLDKSLNTVCNFKVIKYGFTWKKSNKFTRYIDYISLLIILFSQLPHKYNGAHFCLKAGALFRKLVRAEKKSVSCYTSAHELLYKEMASPLLAKLVRERFIFDCLDENIAKILSEKYPENTNNYYVSPCSFLPFDLKIDKMFKEHSIAFVGRLETFKGVELLIDSLIDIIRYTSFHIYVMGNGSYKEKINEVIERNNARHRFTLGYVPNPIAILKKTVCFLSLQKDENYPSQSLLEAMKCENAIIATNVGLTRKIVKLEFGYLISTKEELIKHLVYLDQNIDEAQYMGVNARKFVDSNHRVDVFYNYIKSLYV